MVRPLPPCLTGNKFFSAGKFPLLSTFFHYPICGPYFSPLRSSASLLGTFSLRLSFHFLLLSGPMVYIPGLLRLPHSKFSGQPSPPMSFIPHIWGRAQVPPRTSASSYGIPSNGTDRRLMCGRPLSDFPVSRFVGTDLSSPLNGFPLGHETCREETTRLPLLLREESVRHPFSQR